LHNYKKDAQIAHIKKIYIN